MAQTKNSNFYVVGIGASAGGLDPIQQLFDAIPRFSKAAFVVVQHLSPNFVSLMDELLRKHTDMKVSTAKDDELILANRVYLVPRKKYIRIEKNRLKITDKDESSLNMPIDVFFNSLAKELKEKAIVVVLSGSGTDGSRGVKTIAEKGGIVMVQSLQTAQFNGMPTASLNAGVVDFIGTPDEIAERILRICEMDNVGKDLALMKAEKLPYNKILSILLSNSGIDFKYYRPGTLSRRIQKRIQLLGLESIAGYYEYLTSHEDESKILSKEFLIGVTKFFRNNEAFEVIKKEVIPALFNNAQGNQPIRLWVMACSTGEEAFSLAILLYEYKRLHNLSPSFKIYASDVDSYAITKAQQGVFAGHITEDIPSPLLERYFHRKGNMFEVIKEIRETIVFAVHDVIVDPPFIHMDFISSRNFLIYIDAKPQKILIDKFHYSLNENGFLFLGSSESLQGKDADFKVINNKWRIFRCINALSKPISELVLTDVSATNTAKKKTIIQDEIEVWTSTNNPKINFTDLLLKHYAPSACIFVNEELQVYHIFGDIEMYLEFPTTSSEFSLDHMIEKNQLILFKNGVKNALAKNKPYSVKEFPFKKKGKNLKLNLKFTPQWIEDREEKVVLIEFLSSKNTTKKEIETFFSKEKFTKEQIKTLELELLETKQKLKVNQEKFEITNEEFQAANEELMSANEEMQSTNEELQSVNEELYTVNAELNLKIQELTSLNNDVDNLLSSTNIGTIFLDNELRIRKFTPAIRYQFNIVAGDIGRPIYHFSSYFGFENFKSQILEVLTSLESKQININNESGRAYLMNINPFITSDQEVKGVVISFIDVDELSKQQDEVQKSKRRFSFIFEHLPIMMHTMKPTGEIVEVSHYWLKELGYEKEEVVGKSINNFISDDAKKNMTLTKIENQFKPGSIPFVACDFIKKGKGLAKKIIAITPEKDKDNNISNLFAICLNRQPTKEKSITAINDFIEKLISPTPMLLFIHNFLTDKNEFINNDGQEVLGYNAKELEQNKIELLNLIHPHDIKSFITNHHYLVNEFNIDMHEYDCRLLNKNGHYELFNFYEKVIERDSHGHVIKSLGIAQATTQVHIEKIMD